MLWSSSDADRNGLCLGGGRTLGGDRRTTFFGGGARKGGRSSGLSNVLWLLRQMILFSSRLVSSLIPCPVSLALSVPLPLKGEHE